MKRKNAKTLVEVREEVRGGVRKRGGVKKKKKGRMGKVEVMVRFEVKVRGVREKGLEEGIRKAIGEIKRGSRGALEGGVNVLVADDARMRRLHRQYKGENTTTDVLTFWTGEDGGREAEQSAIDIVVCADEARRMAKEMGHEVERELLLYVVHGLLHCCGFDDGTVKESKRMHEEEDRILEAIGVGATYRLKKK